MFAFASLLEHRARPEGSSSTWSSRRGAHRRPVGDRVRQPGHDRCPYLDLLQAGRSQGAVGDPDFFAGMWLVFVPLGIVLASEAQRKWVRWLMVRRDAHAARQAPSRRSRAAPSSRRGARDHVPGLAAGAASSARAARRPSRCSSSRSGWSAFFSRPFVREEVVTPRGVDLRAEDAGGGVRRRPHRASGRARCAPRAENPILGVGYGSFPTSPRS